MSDNAVVNAILPSLNALLQIREQTAYIDRLYKVTRIYEDDGYTYTETQEEITPIPAIKYRNKDFSLRAQGELEEGDLYVSMISKATYTSIEQLQTLSDPESSTIFLYKFKNVYYTATQIKENILTWDLVLRRWNG